MIMTLQDRIDLFNKDLQELLDDHQFAIASEALIVDGAIVSKVVVVDNPTVASKLAAEKNAKEETPN